MSETAFALFDTAIGRCAIVWSARGIAGVGFPEDNEQATRKRILRRHPSAREASPPRDVQDVIDDIVALLGGTPRDLRHARVDMAGLSDLQRRVYDVARGIPFGATLTYGEIAERLGDRLLARDVGEALGANPFPIVVPCHRVLAAGGVFAFTVETHSDGGVKLQPTLRYAYGEGYLRAAIGEAGLTLVTLAAASVRTENGVPVPGLVAVSSVPQA